MNGALLFAAIACAISAALEGLFAGRGVKEHMASLRMPRYSPPLWLWYIIGAVYYVGCFVVLYRLLGHVPPSGSRTAALVLTLLLMSINAGWNYIFFRARSLRGAFLAGVPYNLIALALMVALLPLDSTAALVFAPYVLYLIYANFWGYRLWRLNR